MDLRSFPGERGSEFYDDIRPTRDAFVQRIQPWAISHGQREVMQADIGAPVKRDGACRRLDLPQGDDQAAVGDEDGGIIRPLTDDIPPEAVAKEAAGAFKVSDAQSDMIDADCGRGGIGHRELSYQTLTVAVTVYPFFLCRLPLAQGYSIAVARWLLVR